ncbi:MAG: sigma-70 family RNA polymerase sigma factor [Ruminococcaceae bacterium]|nr:sigma-70 family RNA polymerase sigma factor [Oscillospiraceae bacterium]
MLFYLTLSTLAEDERSCAEEIFITYGKKIYSIAYKILKNHQDAEDTLDRVMINVMENIEKFSNQSRNIVEAQIVIYTRNAAITLYRKNMHKSKYETPFTYVNDDGEQIEVDLPDERADVEKITISKENAAILEKYLLQLSEDHRDIIKLIYLYGYSYKEAGKILHITPNAVASRLFRAKTKLINMVGGGFNERI